MAALHGKAGSVLWDTNSTDNVTNWTLDIIGDIAETTNMTANFKSSISTFKSWTAVVESIFDDAGLDPDLGNDLIDPNGATLVLSMGTGGRKYTGTAIVSSIAPSVDKDGVVLVTYSFTGNGAVVESAA